MTVHPILTGADLDILRLPAIKHLTEKTIQIAVRALFVLSAVFVTAAALPLTFHAIVLPLVGLNAFFLSLFFYEDLDSNSQINYAAEYPPLIQRPNLPIDAPVGMVNHGNNCAFNSCKHFFQSIPPVYDWLIDGKVIEDSFDHFKDFLPDSFVDKFECFIDPLIPDFDTYRPRSVGEILSEFISANPVVLDHLKKIKILQQAYRDFNDDSRVLRAAYHSVSNKINARPYHEDAGELLHLTFDALPNSLKFGYEINYFLENNTVLRKRDLMFFFTLELKLNERNVGTLFQDYLYNQGPFEPYQGVAITRCESRFLQAPQTLCFQIKRFQNAGGKISDPIEVPSELAISIDGTNRTYKLTSFVKHIGATCTSGHYIAGRIINRNKYIINDTTVTLVGDQKWQQELQDAYLLCYLPMQQD